MSRVESGASSYYLYNGHGDVTTILNASGVVIAGYYYDAFGVQLDVSGSVSNPYRYSGYVYDEETNLYYLNARFYNPEVARFLQEDSYRGNIGDPLSLNLYAYVSYNPLVYYDPSGHLPIEVPAIDRLAHFRAEEAYSAASAIYNSSSSTAAQKAQAQADMASAQATMASIEKKYESLLKETNNVSGNGSSSSGSSSSSTNYDSNGSPLPSTPSSVSSTQITENYSIPLADRLEVQSAQDLYYSARAIYNTPSSTAEKKAQAQKDMAAALARISAVEQKYSSSSSGSGGNSPTVTVTVTTSKTVTVDEYGGSRASDHIITNKVTGITIAVDLADVMSMEYAYKILQDAIHYATEWALVDSPAPGPGDAIGIAILVGGVLIFGGIATYNGVSNLVTTVTDTVSEWLHLFDAEDVNYDDYIDDSIDPKDTWGDPSTLDEHYDRHGKEVGAKDVEDYAEKANDFYKNRDKYQSKVDQYGNTRVYNDKTGIFGSYNPDGTTRTYLKRPRDGQGYFDRQPGN